MARRTAPAGVGVWNPAFDMTPAELVTAIITEAGSSSRRSRRSARGSTPIDGVRFSRWIRAPPARPPSSSIRTAPCSAAATANSPSISPARLGRARSRGDLPGLGGGHARGAGRRRGAARRARYHQPTGDGGAVGPANARAGGAGHRLAGPPDHGALSRAARVRGRAACCASAPDWWPTPTSPPPSWSGCCGIPTFAAAPAGASSPRAPSRAGWWRSSPVAGSTSPITPTPPERCSTISAPATGIPSCSSLFGVPREVLPGLVRLPGRGRETEPAHLGRPHPHCRTGRRSAGGAIRPGLRVARPGQEHLRYRGVPPGAGGRSRCPRLRPACWPRRRAARGVSRLVRAGRERVHRRSRDPMAAGRARPDRAGGGKRSAGAERSRQRRSALRSGVRGAGHTLLGAGGQRGTITGLTRGTTRAHLVRAALEAMAYSSAELLSAMAAAEQLKVPALRVDGGAAANDWLMQFQADVLGDPGGAARPGRDHGARRGRTGRVGRRRLAEHRSIPAGPQFTRFEPRSDAEFRRAHLAAWRRAGWRRRWPGRGCAEWPLYWDRLDRGGEPSHEAR